MPTLDTQQNMLAEFHAALPVMATALSTLDGNIWRVTRESRDAEDGRFTWYGEIGTEAGDALSLSIDTHKGRVTVSGVYGPMPDGRRWIPRDSRIEIDSPTMAFARGPQVIAREIARRFLGQYREALAAYRARLAESTAFRSGVQTLHDELVRLSAGALQPDTRSDKAADERRIRLYHVAGVSYGDLRICSGNSVRLECSIDADTARRFVQMLAVHTAVSS